MVDPTPTTPLRQAPRQQRARDRVEAILDAAATVFEEVGYEQATTSMIGEQAGVSPGTLYRWFPDKVALADALAERYLDALMAFYGPLLDNDPDEPVPAMVRRVVRDLTAFVGQQGALAALLASEVSPTKATEAGRRLQRNLGDQIRALLQARVPDIAMEERERVTGLVLRVLLMMLTTLPGMDLDERASAADDYADLLVAYIDAKFPSDDDPVWGLADPPVRPFRPAPQVDSGA